MTLRGTFRTLAATSRRIEREQHRKHRALVERQKHALKLAAAQRAELEVAAYENAIDLITSVHRDCSDVWDWNGVKSIPAPVPPKYSDHLETTQRQREQLHQPGILDKMFGRADAKATAAERAISQAKAADQNRYDAALKEYEGKLEEWRTLQRIAAGIVANEFLAFREALDELNPIGEIKEVGRQVRLSFSRAKAEATVSLYGPERIPREIKSLLKSGSVSAKPASDGLTNQTYQTHVCSCVLRVARELFAVLPFQTVLVHGVVELLNPQTGHKEPHTIISVLLPRSTFSTLDFERIDPVYCMRNFVHRIEFSKLRGFSSVSPINPHDYERQSPTDGGT
jgi:hypothetical protein